MHTYRSDVDYYVFDLTSKINSDSAFVTEKLTAIRADIEKGSIHPLFFTKFPINEVRNAFKYMAQAKHIGKVIINMAVEDKPVLNIYPESAYLITGTRWTRSIDCPFSSKKRRSSSYFSRQTNSG